MERLTKYDKNFKCYLPFSLADNWSEIKIINKLGELEDALEKYGIENAEELDGVLKPLIDNCELENWKSAIFWKTQTERLAQELADLQHRLEVAERTLELACTEELREIGIYPDDLDYKKEMSILEKQYKKQAEKELKGE